MKEMFSPESPVMAALHRLMDLVEVNLAWALCCIPIVTIGASTVSLYGTIAAMQREQTNKEQAVDILPCFFSLFRRELRQSTLLMLIKALAILILAADARIAGLLSGSLANMVSIMFWIAAVPASMAGGFIYPVQAKFSNSVVQNAKNAALMAFSNPSVSISVAVLNGIPLALLFAAPRLFVRSSFFWLVVGIAGTAWINWKMLHPVFERYCLQATEEESQ